MAKVQITFDSENISKPPHVKVDGKPVEFLHNISFDWNTRTIEKDTIAGFVISRWNENQNLITEEAYTSEFLGKDFQ